MLQMPCFVFLPLEYQELNLTSSTTVCHSKATFLQEGGKAAKVVTADVSFTRKWILLFMPITSYFKSHESVSNWRRSWIILLYPDWEGRLGIELVACLLPGGCRTPKQTNKEIKTIKEKKQKLQKHVGIQKDAERQENLTNDLYKYNLMCI